jgi:hypothetical protein
MRGRGHKRPMPVRYTVHVGHPTRVPVGKSRAEGAHDEIPSRQQLNRPWAIWRFDLCIRSETARLADDEHVGQLGVALVDPSDGVAVQQHGELRLGVVEPGDGRVHCLDQLGDGRSPLGRLPGGR